MRDQDGPHMRFEELDLLWRKLRLLNEFFCLGRQSESADQEGGKNPLEQHATECFGSPNRETDCVRAPSLAATCYYFLKIGAAMKW